MPTKGAVPWPIAPHTEAKHQIYSRYLARWFPILLRGKNSFKSATYAEGFAGPGIYAGGEPGSPVLAIGALLGSDELKASSKLVNFVFVDDDPRCVNRLTRELQEKVLLEVRDSAAGGVTGVILGRPVPVHVAITMGTCEDRLTQLLDAVDAWNKPILAVLDSWGNLPFPYSLLERLAANRASEVIITFTPQHFIRFVDQKGPGVDDAFGHSPNWRLVGALTDGEAKRRFLLTSYRAAVQRAGFAYLLDFELIDTKGESLYIIFATNNALGLSKMKESLWEVDPNFGVKFRDPRDTMSEALFAYDEPQDAPLQRLLLGQLARLQQSGKDWEWVENLRRFALHETVYREPHVIPALEKLRDQGLIETDANGRLRRGSKISPKAAP